MAWGTMEPQEPLEAAARGRRPEQRTSTELQWEGGDNGGSREPPRGEKDSPCHRALGGGHESGNSESLESGTSVLQLCGTAFSQQSEGVWKWMHPLSTQKRTWTCQHLDLTLMKREVENQ